jgi:phosphatidylserine/phosphatidylglycerophosphate/cardiolipin synthase-like enzyme
MSQLDDLKTAYFGSATAHDEVTDITYFVDGRDYFRAIRDAIAATVSGDAVYMVGWWFDVAFEPYGTATPATLPSLKTIGQLLADRANSGVDVRVVINGAQYLGVTSLTPAWQSNFIHMRALQALLPPGASLPPLADAAAYDWSGARRTGSHHQKATVVIGRTSKTLTAFVGGMDCNPLHLDAAPHNTKTVPAPTGGTVPWGWHDTGVRLVGGAAIDVYSNFADRWKEACTLPTASIYMGGFGSPWKRISYTPPTPKSLVPLPSPITPPAPTLQTSAQVLRSRYRWKIERPMNNTPWLTKGGGEILEVHDALVKAIDAAQDYIYIEDQFLGDHPALDTKIHAPWWAVWDLIIDSRLSSFSLIPHLSAAAARKVNVIFVGSGYADPGDALKGPKNLTVHPELADLATANPDHVAIWRIEGTTVHSKAMIIDDVFASVGSANIQSRSMLGIDSELHTTVVAVDGPNSVVKQLRKDLWREHVGVASTTPGVEAALDDLKQAISMWRTTWGIGGGLWFASNNPPGFVPPTMGPGGARSQVVRAYVGPGTSP